MRETTMASCAFHGSGWRWLERTLAKAFTGGFRQVGQRCGVVDPVLQRAIETALFACLARMRPGGSICPSEVARSVQNRRQSRSAFAPLFEGLAHAFGERPRGRWARAVRSMPWDLPPM